MDIVLYAGDKLLKQITSLTESIIIKHRLKTEIVFSSCDPCSIKSFISTNDKVSLYFIEMSEENTDFLTICSDIRSSDPYSSIALICPGAIENIYDKKLKILDIIKPEPESELSAKLEDCILFTDKKQKRGYRYCFNTYHAGKNFSVPYKNIYYIETMKGLHKLKMFCRGGTYEFYGSITDVLNSTDNCFIQCHKSYIVNRSQVVGINKHYRTIQMISGLECPYSKHFFNSKEFFQEQNLEIFRI